jgi:hypothetical protein
VKPEVGWADFEGIWRPRVRVVSGVRFGGRRVDADVVRFIGVEVVVAVVVEGVYGGGGGCGWEVWFWFWVGSILVGW